MDEENKKFTLAGKEFHEGDYISIDGSTGNIYDGAILIHLLTLKRLVSLVQRVSVFAVQSTCSSKRTESLHSVK